MKRKVTLSFVLALTLSLLGGCHKTGSASSSGKKSGGKQALLYPVETASVTTRPVVYSVNAVGSVEAFEVVQATARVAGVVDRLLFAEGKRVSSGETLVEIDADRYRLAVESAQATFERAQAAQIDAAAGLKRREAVIQKNPGLIPAEEMETWRTKVRVTSADQAQALSALNQAKLNLRDAFVKAPVSGVVQTRTVQTGQYVQPGSVLATLIRRDPLLLRFKVTEAEASRLSLAQKAFFTVKNDSRKYAAKVSHVAASAETGTRMVEVTALVDDAQKEILRPGAFAEISLPIGNPQPRPVVPQTAIRPSEKGFLAYIVVQGKAKEVILSLGLSTEDGSVEVREGLKPGDQIVIRGSEALKDGVSVKVNNPVSKTGR